MSTTAQQMRAGTGPTLLTFGFRPFFLGAAIWALVAMVLWTLMLTRRLSLPTAFDLVSWHAHEFLFGYLSAVIAGFLLTAVPNWTGRLPIVGWPLGGLFLLWILGRIAVATYVHLSPLTVAMIDLSMQFALGVVIAREIVAGKNWRNLMVLGMLGMMTLGNGIFHWEVAQGGYAAQGYGLRIGLGAALMMIAVIGGRVVPSFTRNWLVKRGASRLPAPPMQTFDKIALLILIAALGSWVAFPENDMSAVLLIVAGVVHLVRLARWRGVHTVSEPLVLVLHAGYLFLPLGALAKAAEIMMPDFAALGAVQHLWMGGAIGLMTLAVMTRATLGHSGQTLHSGWATSAIYIALILAVTLRISAGIWPESSHQLYSVSAVFWIMAFGGFLIGYARMLLFVPPPKQI